MINDNSPFLHNTKEFDLIYRYFHLPAKNSPNQTNEVDVNTVGIGDDCALLTIPEAYEIAISTDTLVEGRHFLHNTDPADIAYKAFMVSFSDLAAMGAIPKWLSIALTMPQLEESWLSRFSKQLFHLTDAYNIKVIGGDTTKGPLSITFIVKGLVKKGQALRRKNAIAGDDIYVSGYLGSSALGLALIENKNEGLNITQPEHLRNQIIEEFNPSLHIDNLPISASVRSAIDYKKYFIGSYLFPKAQIELGKALINIANSAIDISDGLSSDLMHICASSGIKAEIFLDRIPLNGGYSSLFDELFESKKYSGVEYALTGGDDYQLLFTAPANLNDQIKFLSQELNIPLTCIGKMKNGSPQIDYYFNKERIATELKGFDHFSL